MKVAVFDIGGTLRRVRLPGVPIRNWPALQVLYETLRASKFWRVVIVTVVPQIRSREEVVADIRSMGLGAPDELRVLRGDEQKGPVYKELGADLVFDNEERWCEQAVEHGAMGLRVV